MAKTANSANSAKSAKMAVVMGSKGVTNSKTAAEKVAAPQQLILLPTAAEEPKTAPKAPKAEAPKAEAPKTVAPKAEAKPEAPKAVAKAEPKHKMSIDELTDKAERVFLLQGKYAEVRAKRKQLQSFTIKHEEETAQLTLVDAKGMSIVTHNPTAIKHLLDDWAKDLDNHLTDIENQLRKELENLN